MSSGATTVSSLGTLATATTNAAFWDATKKELHLKLVATAGATYNASSSWVTFAPVSGTRLTASVNGIKSRPYDGAARKTGTVIEAEDFDLGGQNVAYYSASRYTATDPVTGQPIYLLSSTDYNHADEVRIGEMVKLKKVFSGTSPVTATDYTKANEYLKYTIDVLADGFYDIQLQMGAQNASNQLQILQNDTLLRTETIPRLGTSTEIKPYTINGIALKKGVRVLTLKMLTNLMAFDKFTLQYSAPLALKDNGKKDTTNVEIDDKTLSVYPNPATDMVNIKFKTWQPRRITIYNQFNKMVYSNKILGSELAISTKDIGGLGVYFVVVNNEMHKLVIVK